MKLKRRIFLLLAAVANTFIFVNDANANQFWIQVINKTDTEFILSGNGYKEYIDTATTPTIIPNATSNIMSLNIQLGDASLDQSMTLYLTKVTGELMYNVLLAGTDYYNMRGCCDIPISAVYQVPTDQNSPGSAGYGFSLTTNGSVLVKNPGVMVITGHDAATDYPGSGSPLLTLTIDPKK